MTHIHHEALKTEKKERASATLWKQRLQDVGASYLSFLGRSISIHPPSLINNQKLGTKTPTPNNGQTHHASSGQRQGTTNTDELILGRDLKFSDPRKHQEAFGEESVAMKPVHHLRLCRPRERRPVLVWSTALRKPAHHEAKPNRVRRPAAL